MRTVILMAMLLLGFLVGCSQSQDVNANYEAADLLFFGYVDALKQVPEGIEARFKVKQEIKGLSGSEVTVFVQGTICGSLIESGSYLVYAQRINGQLWVDLCNGTKHRSFAQSDLDYIHTFNPKVARECTSARLRNLAQKASTVVVADVVNIIPSVWHSWSGIVMFTEEVLYRPEKAIKGTVPQDPFIVEHALVFNSLTADINTPRLSRKLFAEGNELMLFLGDGTITPSDRMETRASRGVSYVSLDEDCGVIPSDQSTIEDLKNLGLQN